MEATELVGSVLFKGAPSSSCSRALKCHSGGTKWSESSRYRSFCCWSPSYTTARLASSAASPSASKKDTNYCGGSFPFSFLLSFTLVVDALVARVFFPAGLKKKRNNKQHRWTELDTRRDRSFLSSFCVSATLARSVRTVT